MAIKIRFFLIFFMLFLFFIMPAMSLNELNDTEGFADTFAGTGIVLNTRIVGSADLVLQKVSELWKPGMKLIVVTYCETPAEQEMLYHKIHEICQ